MIGRRITAMTGSLIIIGMVLLLAAALELTHRRTLHHWRPGLDTRSDRDLARTEEELRFVAQADQRTTAEAPIVHLDAPRSAATDARFITRTAA
jgi:hypothetical protein